MVEVYPRPRIILAGLGVALLFFLRPKLAIRQHERLDSTEWLCIALCLVQSARSKVYNEAGRLGRPFGQDVVADDVRLYDVQIAPVRRDHFCRFIRAYHERLMAGCLALIAAIGVFVNSEIVRVGHIELAGKRWPDPVNIIDFPRAVPVDKASFRRPLRP